MTINDKLDFLLSIFKNNPNKYSITYDNVKFLLKNELSETELSSMLDKLVEDENVDFNHNFGYKEKLKGTLFLENGGYVQQEIERQLDINSKKSSIKSLKLNKWILGFTIATLAITIISISISYNNKNILSVVFLIVFHLYQLYD